MVATPSKSSVMLVSVNGSMGPQRSGINAHAYASPAVRHTGAQSRVRRAATIGQRRWCLYSVVQPRVSASPTICRARCRGR